MVTSGEESDSVSSLVWWRVPTAASVRALYALAHSVAQPDRSGLVHSDDVIRQLRLFPLYPFEIFRFAVYSNAFGYFLI